MNTKLLFILGAPKTGTSTIMGIVNLHPKIFIMSECFMRKEIKHGAKYYKHYNVKHRHMFEKRKSISSQYNMVYNVISENSGVEYEYFGDKWACLDDANEMALWMKEFKNHKIIFTIRDIRTWLAHSTVQSKALISNNAYYGAMNYVYYFIKSFEHKDCIRVRLEDFVNDNEMFLSNLNKHIGLNISEYTNEWWNKIGTYNDVNKNIYKWWEADRQSSFVKPYGLDISVKIKDNLLWDRALPIFDKYYNNYDKHICDDEIASDLCKIKEYLKENIFISPNECFISTNINKIKRL